MDKRFLNIFPGLSEEKAIALLETPIEELEDKSDRYIAASHLVNFPSERSINVLIKTLQDTNPVLEHKIARRKAIETLGRLNAVSALPAIRACLSDEDCYTVENAVWAISEIGTEDPEIIAEIARLLEKPAQSYRLIIQVLGKFNYKPAIDKIQQFTASDDEPIASAAIATVCRLTGDYSQMTKVLEFLEHSNVNARRGCIQDLIDTKYYPSIPNIAKCPVSMVFRLRGIRLLAETGIPTNEINFAEIEPYLDLVVRDHPNDLELVHEYDQTPTLEFAIQELYSTDFGRCYLAGKTLLENYPEVAGAALMATFAESAHNDYGAHYHVVKLLGWLKYVDSYDLLVEALHNTAPQFQKSRGAAALALANLGDERVIPLLRETISQTRIFDLKYACLLGLKQLGDSQAVDLVANDSDLLIQAKAKNMI
ncbi:MULTISPECIES: HEAT repeat domain-containing protein [Okeania]|uniref:HEAT repeat domain-containing protein n=1 Tax=Okeania hirsuta TaxID=1458930 RepID=A0A3N6P578_9CYAN|nr:MULTISPECIES: HEAT repeat domain-containing protein [Okeania]NES91467.1 HEAT repeat domain-containing protein [Okeania sp. SIO2B9]NET80158.1 HEAT repeat domain-containing protein [Okeania sp. SIO1F9]RQH07290.1 HEAT repeat domain-containing protein [Okeania hirsuta]RQH28884.1 HEAT repeat domain-containing protein [Okeania hirsuta]